MCDAGDSVRRGREAYVCTCAALSVQRVCRKGRSAVSALPGHPGGASRTNAGLSPVRKVRRAKRGGRNEIMGAKRKHGGHTRFPKNACTIANTGAHTIPLQHPAHICLHWWTSVSTGYPRKRQLSTKHKNSEPAQHILDANRSAHPYHPQRRTGRARAHERDAPHHIPQAQRATCHWQPGADDGCEINWNTPRAGRRNQHPLPRRNWP